MTINRSRTPGNFTQIPNATLRDPRISAKAQGILTFMLSMSDDWQFYTKEIATHFTDGQKSIESGLKELETAGYLERIRRWGPHGQMIAAAWNVRDLVPAAPDTTRHLPETENRGAVKSPAYQQSGNENLDISTFSPHTDFRGDAKGGGLKGGDAKGRVSNGNLRRTTKRTTNLNNTELNEDQNKQGGGGGNNLHNSIEATPPHPATETTATSTEGQYSHLVPIQEAWEQNGFGTFPGGHWQVFAQWVRDFEKLGAAQDDAVAMIVRAVREAADSGVRTYKYLNGILNRYASSKYLTVADIDAHEAAREQRKPTRAGSSKPQPKLYRDSDTDWEHMEGF